MVAKRVVRVDVPAIADPRGAPHRDVGIGADPDRRGRFLQRLDRAGGVVELPVGALHVDEVFGPQAFDCEHHFLEPRAELAARHTERLELDIAVADAGAEDEAAAGHQVERRQLLGKVERLVQRRQHQAADDPQPRRDRRAIGEKRDLLHRLERVGAEMRALDDAVEAKPVGGANQVEIVIQMPDDVALRVLAADDQAQLEPVTHRPCLSRPARGGRWRSCRGSASCRA